MHHVEPLEPEPCLCEQGRACLKKINAAIAEAKAAALYPVERLRSELGIRHQVEQWFVLRAKARAERYVDLDAAYRDVQQAVRRKLLDVGFGEFKPGTD